MFEKSEIGNRKPVRLFSDGGSRGNPGHAGAGYVLYDEDNKEIYSGKKFLGVASNNVAEYTALILGMEKAKELKIVELTCFLDSELIVKQLNGLYKVKHPDMKLFFTQVKKLLAEFKNITFVHIRREKNKRADTLANQAMDEGATIFPNSFLNTETKD